MALDFPGLPEAFGLSDDLVKEFSQQDIDKVLKGRKDTLPQFYNSGTKKKQQISRDFESFLLLLESSVKNSAITWLRKVKVVNNTRKDRDEILAMAFDNEIADAKEQYSALSSSVGDFDTFSSEFRDPRYGAVTENGLILAAMQSMIGEKKVYLDRMLHLQTFSEFTKQAYNSSKASQDTIKEIDSWITILTEYL